MIQFFSTADNITAIAAASLALSPAIRSAYRRTLGSARRTSRALRTLSPGNPVELVDDLFGRHIYARSYELTYLSYPDHKDVSIERRLYNASHGWLTCHFHEGKLIAFAFMITDRYFRFEIGPTCRNMLRGVLGRTTFKEISPDPPGLFRSFMALYNFGYHERHNFARFGNYHYYVLSCTMFGWRSKGSVATTLADGEQAVGADLQATELAELQYYRSSTAPDTVALFQSDYDWSGIPYESGAFDREDLNDVEGAGPRGWRSRSSTDNRTPRFIDRLRSRRSRYVD